ncbi:MAG: ABC transporter ATP-binding protein [Planctomycetota bacterium]|jgi:ABC-2 type transport system ATP-binding protein
MIEVKDLRKAYGPIVAVDGISFAAGKGDVMGFLGPNGAGKSTTMKMLACFLEPDSGTATINGRDILKDPIGVRQSLGYVAESAPAYDEMTPESFLSFVCDARGFNRRRRHEAIDRVAEQCAITRVMHQPIGTLSKGFRRRVCLAQALVHDPSVLLLDEPTDGLDPNQKHDVRELIKEMAKDKCIMISTHILEEVEAICNRLIIIDQGAVLVDSQPDTLVEKEGGSLDAIFRRMTTKHAAAVGGAA